MDMQASDNQPLWPPEKLEGAERTRSGSAECVGAELEGVQIPQAAPCISMMVLRNWPRSLRIEAG